MGMKLFGDDLFMSFKVKKMPKPRLATLLFSEVQLISYARLKSVTGSQSLLPSLGYSRTQLF